MNAAPARVKRRPSSRGRAAATELFLLDEADGLHCFRKIMAEQA
jgi:hypothetical protein